MTCAVSFGIWIVLSLVISVLKYRGRTPFVEKKLQLSHDAGEERVTILLKLLDIKYADVIHFDKLFWQIPAWVTTIGAGVVFTGGNVGGASHVASMFPSFLCIYGIFTLLAGYFLFRLVHHRTESVAIYRSVATEFGDESVPRPKTPSAGFNRRRSR